VDRLQDEALTGRHRGDAYEDERLDLHRSTAPGRVQLLGVDAQDLLDAGDGLMEHPPQRLLPQVHLTPRDQPVDRHFRAAGVSESGGVALSPSRIGDIARAALALNRTWK
jgi:hypothetical protein